MPDGKDGVCCTPAPSVVDFPPVREPLTLPLPIKSPSGQMAMTDSTCSALVNVKQLMHSALLRLALFVRVNAGQNCIAFA